MLIDEVEGTQDAGDSDDDAVSIPQSLSRQIRNITAGRNLGPRDKTPAISRIASVLLLETQDVAEIRERTRKMAKIDAVRSFVLRIKGKEKRQCLVVRVSVQFRLSLLDVQ